MLLRICSELSSLQPPRGHFSNIEANESEEVRQFRKLFAQLAGDVSILGPLALPDCDIPESPSSL